MYNPRYFHVYNRGLDKRKVFLSEVYFERFLLTTMLARLKNAPAANLYFKQQKLGLLPKESEIENRWGPPVVDIIAYCLMPNHFHFLLKELTDQGVAKFMQRLGNAYTKYFNAKELREGRIFTFKYKFVPVENDEQLIHLTKYIHLNPHTSSKTKLPKEKTHEYPWSSMKNYISKKNDLYCQSEEVLSFFSSTKDYINFVYAGIGDSLELYSKEAFIDIEEPEDDTI